MRLNRYNFISIACFLTLLFAACEKSEAPIAKPLKGESHLTRVDMGEEYADQIFFDFASGQPVMVSKINSWDLAFEADPSGYHVFMNGGKDVWLYNTHKTNPASVTDADAYMLEDKDWGFDNPNGKPGDTYVGDWRGKNEVFMVKFNDGTFKKFVISSVTDTSYTVLYGDVNSAALSSIQLPKDPAYNYSYFLFDGGQVTHPDPVKSSYDIVFTRYRHIYYDLPDSTRYAVNGALLNPYNTSAVADSSYAYTFESVTAASSFVQGPFSDNRDVIGFDWKKFVFSSQRYETDAGKLYVVKTRNGEYWKLHFLNFYTPNGLKGSPSFEFDRIK